MSWGNMKRSFWELTSMGSGPLVHGEGVEACKEPSWPSSWPGSLFAICTAVPSLWMIRTVCRFMFWMNWQRKLCLGFRCPCQIPPNSWEVLKYKISNCAVVCLFQQNVEVWEQVKGRLRCAYVLQTKAVTLLVLHCSCYHTVGKWLFKQASWDRGQDEESACTEHTGAGMWWEEGSRLPVGRQLEPSCGNARTEGLNTRM